MEDFNFWIGIGATVAITVANFPQVVKLYKSGDAKSISAVTYSLLVVGNLLWLGYGISKTDWPIIVGNAIATVLCCAILSMKLFPSIMRQKNIKEKS